MLNLVSFLSDLLWGSVVIYLLVGGGIYFTIRLCLIQFSGFSKIVYVFKHSRQLKHLNHPRISSFQALCTALAARIGTGNMVGVSIALTFGGPGALFWMWVIAFLGMATTFAECTLAQLYKEQDQNGIFRGGPAYYMDKGLGFRWMGIFYAVSFICAFGLVFNAVQANAMSYAGYAVFDIDPIYMAVILVVITAGIIFGGIGRVAVFSEIIAPVMVLFYLLTSVFLILKHAEMLPDIFQLVFRQAFGFDAAASGALGFSFTQGMMQGIKSGLFSNEAGMGSAPNIAASAEPYPSHPASQGFIHMLGVFIDTFVICTLSALVILLSGEYVPGSDMTGIALILRSFSALMGESASTFIALAVFFFSFTSIMANYAYAETNFLYLTRQNPRYLFALRMCVLMMLILGTQMYVPVVWVMADLAMAVTAMINMIALLLLSRTVITLSNDFNAQWMRGRHFVFSYRRYTEFHDSIYAGSWHKPMDQDAKSTL